MKIRIPEGQTVKCSHCRQPASDIMMIHDGSLYCYHCFFFELCTKDDDLMNSDWLLRVCKIEGEEENA